VQKENLTLIYFYKSIREELLDMRNMCKRNSRADVKLVVL